MEQLALREFDDQRRRCWEKGIRTMAISTKQAWGSSCPLKPRQLLVVADPPKECATLILLMSWRDGLNLEPIDLTNGDEQPGSSLFPLAPPRPGQKLVGALRTMRGQLVG
jgi:hypothetical protein